MISYPRVVIMFILQAEHMCQRFMQVTCFFCCRTVNYSRIFTEMAESFLDLIVSSPNSVSVILFFSLVRLGCQVRVLSSPMHSYE